MKSMGRAAKYSEEKQKEIALAYLGTDKSRREIAEEFSISMSTLDRYVKRFEFEKAINDD